MLRKTSCCRLIEASRGRTIQRVEGRRQLLRGPDSSELESDLSKVERRLSLLDLDGILSPAERELEKLYFIQWRRRLHRLLKKEAASLNQGGQKSTTQPGSH